MMRVLICNERLLFRFGVDRVLLIIARALRDRGHHVTLMAHRLNVSVAESVADRVVELPPQEVPYLDLDDSTCNWLRTHLPAWDIDLEEFDLALIGGWPFFGSIEFLGQKGVATVFLDCGVVPLDGFQGPARQVQLKVRELRKQTLRHASGIIAISRFIAESQSKLDAPNLSCIRVILLGADHLSTQIWSADQVGSGTEAKRGALARVQQEREAGKRVILNLGRWEPGGYKQSEVVFDLARQLRKSDAADFVIAVLDQPEVVQIPEDLEGLVIPLGFPDDHELLEIMRLAEVGVSVSAWEGFNLPIAEIQWVGKPVLALDLAAHPEVVSHPWGLAESERELGQKLFTLLTSGHPDQEGLEAAIGTFRSQFAWSVVQARYIEACEAFSGQVPRKVVVADVSQACCDGANSGVMRVTRRLTRHLQGYAHVVFAVWDRQLRDYTLPFPGEYEMLGNFNGPLTNELRTSPEGRRIRLRDALAEQGLRPDYLLLPELVDEPRARLARRAAQAQNLPIAAIFYDAIPVLYPEYVSDTAVRENHADYMLGLAETDLVIPISAFSQRCLERFWREERPDDSDLPVVETVLLPDEFGEFPRRQTAKELPRDTPTLILCVSTLEPRKNHLKLLEAIKLLDKLAPDLDWRLLLVGNRYQGADTISLAVRAAALADSRIRPLGVVDDATLNGLYRSATLTVYPSQVEGYGMPILESLWYATPVVCHDDGVMNELASMGGCLTVDMTDFRKLAKALAQLATDPHLYQELSSQATQRLTRSWDTYARDVLNVMSAASHED